MAVETEWLDKRERAFRDVAGHEQRHQRNRQDALVLHAGHSFGGVYLKLMIHWPIKGFQGEDDERIEAEAGACTAYP